MKKKSVALLMVLVLVFGMAVGGTVAWLMDSSEKVINTFTVGDIEITLEETEKVFKIIPGTEIKKDPVVTVLKDSEACWLFVKIDRSNWNENLSYSPADGWKVLSSASTEASTVYYRVVEATTADTPFDVLADNKVIVSEQLTSEAMETMESAAPVLTLQAFAIQYESFAPAGTDEAAEEAAAALAWNEVNPA